MPYLLRTYRLPREAEEALAAALWEAGTLGVEGGAEGVAEEFLSAGGGADADAGGGLIEVTAWFEAGAAESVPDMELPSGVELVGEREEEGKDWMEAYRFFADPFDLGAAFHVDPGEPCGSPPEPPARRLLLRIPARTAFGTGSHESTRLAVRLLESTDLLGKHLLDVGCGTGVLSFCALLLRAKSVTAFDIDPAAAAAARENARLNASVLHRRRSRLRIFAGTAEALRPGRVRVSEGSEGAGGPGAFDLLLINVIPGEIAASLPSLLELLADGGEVLFSGILAEQGEALLADLAELGLSPAAEVRAGEWIAYRLRKDRPGERAGE